MPTAQSVGAGGKPDSALLQRQNSRVELGIPRKQEIDSGVMANHLYLRRLRRERLNHIGSVVQHRPVNRRPWLVQLDHHSMSRLRRKIQNSRSGQIQQQTHGPF